MTQDDIKANALNMLQSNYTPTAMESMLAKGYLDLHSRSDALARAARDQVEQMECDVAGRTGGHLDICRKCALETALMAYEAAKGGGG